MTFVYNVNTFPATGAVAVFQLKELLKSAGWIIKQTSDGTTLSGADIDNIISGSSGAGGMANSNAWYRIQSPDQVREFLIQRGTVNTDYKVRYSAFSKFITGVPTASTPSTAVDEQYILGSSGAFASWMGADNSFYWHGMANDSDGYGFWCLGVKAGLATGGNPAFSSVLVFDPMITGSYNFGDVDPYIVLSRVTSTVVFDSSTLATLAATNFKGWFGYGLTGATFQQVSAQRHITGGTAVIPLGMGNSPFSKKGIFWPVVWARPVIIGNIQPGGIKGLSSLMLWNFTPIANATLLSVESPLDRVVFGDISLPWPSNIGILI